jgi:signal peptidase I
MKSRSIRYLIQVAKLASIGILFIAGAHFFVIQPSEVNGRSMENTLIDGDIILIDKFSLLFRKPHRGDIISVIRKDCEDKLVKRVIGLPGEQVIIENGEVFIVSQDGTKTKLNEPYLEKNRKTFPPTGMSYNYPIISENRYFIMGDNRLESYDSRSYGSIHRSEIIGVIRQFGD